MSRPVIPVLLFAYRRPRLLARALECLRRERVPLVLAFVDGAARPEDRPAQQQVIGLLKAVDWTELRLVVRTQNLGLGRSLRQGIQESTREHEAFIVWEDDLLCSAGAYAWLCEALYHYWDVSKVMSVSAWTHPAVSPSDIGEAPYFDARAECWIWGAWRRSWAGMEEADALGKLRAARKRGLKPDAYGSDLPLMAEQEKPKNIWAVRWLYHHLQHGGLCLRPPRTMSEHIGFESGASNCSEEGWLAQEPLAEAPPIPATWPAPTEHPACATLWRRATRPRPRNQLQLWYWRLRRILNSTTKA